MWKSSQQSKNAVMKVALGSFVFTKVILGSFVFIQDTGPLWEWSSLIVCGDPALSGMERVSSRSHCRRG